MKHGDKVTTALGTGFLAYVGKDFCQVKLDSGATYWLPISKVTPTT